MVGKTSASCFEKMVIFEQIYGSLVVHCPIFAIDVFTHWRKIWMLRQMRLVNGLYLPHVPNREIVHHLKIDKVQ